MINKEKTINTARRVKKEEQIKKEKAINNEKATAFSVSNNLIKKARKALISLFRSFHLSMRRKIVFDYLAIYMLTMLISTMLVPLTFLFVDINNTANLVNQNFNQLFIAFNREIYSEQELEFKIEQLSEQDGVAYQVLIYQGDESKELNYTILTDRFKEVEYPENILNRIQLLFSEKLIAKYVGAVSLENDNGSKNTFVVRALYHMELYNREILSLGLIVFIFYSVGLFFMVMVGGARIKKVLNPIFYMTMTAKQISISNMDMRLDVENTKYELKDLAITLNDMLDRLDKDYSKQKRFVSDVSHELRTPISIINGYASMLERWGKKDEAILDESITAIMGESKSMQMLIENLLTLVRSDNQTLEYNLSSFDIGKMIFDVVKEFNMVNTKNQYITCDSKEQIHVYLDEAKIKQTLRIFVDNAVKYTPKNGGIQVKCYEVKNQIFIHVKDTGIGISKNDLPFLFERFYRSDESRTRETGGHGLGLSIAKVIVLGHTGKIRVKTRLAKGSEFIITLPKRLDIKPEGHYEDSTT